MKVSLLSWPTNILLAQTIHCMTSHDRHGVSDHRQLDCLYNSLFRLTPRKTPKLVLLFLRNPPVALSQTQVYYDVLMWQNLLKPVTCIVGPFSTKRNMQLCQFYHPGILSEMLSKKRRLIWIDISNCHSMLFNSLGPVDAYMRKLTIIDSDNGLSPGRRQAVIWTNAGILLIGHLGTNFSEILIETYTFLLKKIHLKMSSGKWRPFCFGLNVLNQSLGNVSPFQGSGMLLRQKSKTYKISRVWEANLVESDFETTLLCKCIPIFGTMCISCWRTVTLTTTRCCQMKCNL